MRLLVCEHPHNCQEETQCYGYSRLSLLAAWSLLRFLELLQTLACLVISHYTSYSCQPICLDLCGSHADDVDYI